MSRKRAQLTEVTARRIIQNYPRIQATPLAHLMNMDHGTMKSYIARLDLPLPPRKPPQPERLEKVERMVSLAMCRLEMGVSRKGKM